MSELTNKSSLSSATAWTPLCAGPSVADFPACDVAQIGKPRASMRTEMAEKSFILFDVGKKQNESYRALVREDRETLHPQHAVLAFTL